DEPGRARVDGELAEVQEVEADLGRERRHQVRLGDQLLVDENAPERLARARLLLERRRQLLTREQLAGDEELSELVALRHHATRSRRTRHSPRRSTALTRGTPRWCPLRADRRQELEQQSPVDGLAVLVGEHPLQTGSA